MGIILKDSGIAAEVNSEPIPDEYTLMSNVTVEVDAVAFTCISQSDNVFGFL